MTMAITLLFQTAMSLINVSDSPPRHKLGHSTYEGLVQIKRLIGQGTFGKVVQARDLDNSDSVAIKIIRSVQKYRDAAKIELRVLQTLRQNDPDNKYKCIHLRDCFDFQGHICIVTELLGCSLFDFLKGNGFVPFPNSHIQSFAKQLLTSVACKITFPHAHSFHHQKSF